MQMGCAQVAMVSVVKVVKSGDWHTLWQRLCGIASGTWVMGARTAGTPLPTMGAAALPLVYAAKLASSALCKRTGSYVFGSMNMPQHTVSTVRRWSTWRALSLLVALLWAVAAQAAPAPWYWWISKLDGQRVCAQHMPASGWERAEGPFAQAGCKVPQPRALLGVPGR